MDNVEIMVFHGMNLRDARRAAQQLGCLITHPRRTGEEIYRHSSAASSIRVNSRRKDAPRKLTAWLLSIQCAARLARSA